MNCRRFDWAVVIRQPLPWDPPAGLIVRCKELTYHPISDEPGWVLFEDVQDGRNCILDSVLRPLRNMPGEDETLSWLAVPSLQDVALSEL